jgi:hypothetical protein
MLVKVNKIVDKEKVQVTKLDIDDFGSVIPLRELYLKLPTDDNTIIEILESAPYASVFTDSSPGSIADEDENNSTILLANAITIEELNEEKRKIIHAVNTK